METNPYESPVDVVAATPDVLQEKDRIARNIRAICILYLMFGGIAVLGGVALIFNPESVEIPPLVGWISLFGGLAGIVSSVGVLRKRAWGVPVCQIVSAMYLMSFPIGTILGAYFLLNVGKVRDHLR